MTKFCFCHSYDTREAYITALKNSTLRTSNGLHYQEKESLATVQFSGTKQSFHIACGNVPSNQKLKNYGFTSLSIILNTFWELYDEFKISDVSSVIISHYGYTLVKIINQLQTNEPPTVLYLEISDLLDNVQCTGDDASIGEVNGGYIGNSIVCSSCKLPRKNLTMPLLNGSDFLSWNKLSTNRVLIIHTVTMLSLLSLALIATYSQ